MATNDEYINWMASSIDQKTLLFKMEGNYFHIGYVQSQFKQSFKQPSNKICSYHSYKWYLY